MLRILVGSIAVLLLSGCAILQDTSISVSADLLCDAGDPDCRVRDFSNYQANIRMEWPKYILIGTEESITKNNLPPQAQQQYVQSLIDIRKVQKDWSNGLSCFFKNKCDD